MSDFNSTVLDFMARIDERMKNVANALEKHDERTQENSRNIIQMQESLKEINASLKGDGLNQKGAMKRIEALEVAKHRALAVISFIAAGISIAATAAIDWLSNKLGV